MKVLIVISVFAILFSGEAEAFFGKKGGSESAGSSDGGLGGLENILALPLQIKSQIIQAKKAKINKILGSIEGALGKFGSIGGGAGAGAGAGSFGESGSVSNGGSFSTSGSNAGSSSFTGGEVYAPVQAPNAQYHQQPIVIHLYQQHAASGAQSHANTAVEQTYQPAPVQQVYQPEPAPVQTYQPAPVQQVYQPEPAPVQTYQPAPVQTYQPAPVQQVYHPEPAPVQTYQPAPVQQVYQPAPEPVQIYEPAPVQPQITYGPPNHQPSLPISSSQVQTVENTYLPPHGNCQDASHFH